MNNACIDVKGVSMAAISKGTAMAISFPVTLLCSTLKGSVSCFLVSLCSLVIKRSKKFTQDVNTRFPIMNTL